MKKLIIGNWKMNLNFKASLVLAKNYLKLLKNNKQELVICPSEFALAEIKKIIKFSKIKLGAQNISAFERGAHTGSTDGQSLKELGCEFVIIGHSERREQGETSQQVNAKIKQALKNKLTPVVCVGESWEKYKAGHGRAWVANQIKQALAGVSLGQSRLIIAYEPIWAIGSGKPMAEAEADKFQAFIRQEVKKLLGQKAKIAILYGGSVNAKNSASYLKQANIDGLLVGGASLKASEFKKIVD